MYIALMILGRQMHKAEPVVPELCSFGVKTATENLKSCKLSDIDQIAVEMIQAGGNILTILNKKELQGQWKESATVPIYKRVMKLTVVNIKGFHSYHPHKNCIQYCSLKVNSTSREHYRGSLV
jgi:hypothetical protein